MKDEKDMIHIHSGILLSHKKEQNNAIHSNMDPTRDYATKWSNWQIAYAVTFMWNLKYDTTELIYKRETDSQM